MALVSLRSRERTALNMHRRRGVYGSDQTGATIPSPSLICRTVVHGSTCLLSVPGTRTTYGDRSFAVSGPVAWNSLPVALRSSDVTEETFRRQLKTFLFNCLDN